MSNLQKFEATEAWRESLKQHLLAERKPFTNVTGIDSATDRYSLDIIDDFHSLHLAQKKEKITLLTNDSKENQTQSHNGYSAATTNEINNKANKNVGLLTDESFEALERMCNKTISDSNSTLFQYMNSDERDEIMKEAKTTMLFRDDFNNEIESDNEETMKMEIDSDKIETPLRFCDSTFFSKYRARLSPMTPNSPVGKSHVLTQMNKMKDMSNLNNDKSLDKSFNDTLEEVDYMMQKGMEYMTITPNSVSSKNAPAHCPSVKSKQGKQFFTPLQQSQTKQKPIMENKSSDMKPSWMMMQHVNAKKTPVSGKKPQKDMPASDGGQPMKPINRCASNIKAKQKLDFFKPPSNIPTPRQNALKQQYSHIVSPIRTYVQKTATAPLMTTMKSIEKNKIEIKLQQYQPNFSGHSTKIGTAVVQQSQKRVGSPLVPTTLPKKAYISSGVKHVVDERTPVIIPGGEKIQKYLGSVLTPAVLRHDGKIKLPACSKSVTSNAMIGFENQPDRNNKSYAHLSMALGDVSMYTIKDAHKF